MGTVANPGPQGSGAPTQKVGVGLSRKIKIRGPKMRDDLEISPPLQGRSPSGAPRPAMPDTTTESPMKIVRGGGSTYAGLTPKEIQRRKQVQFIKKNPTTTI